MDDAILAIDAMGGDHGVLHNIKAVNKFLELEPSVRVILVGDSEKIAPMVKNPRAKIVHTSEFITMDDSPVEGLRNKKQSSMRIAIDLVKSGKAHAMVTAGNTGAIVALAKLCIGMNPGIKRPVLAAEGIDCNGRSRLFLDLGANVDCTSKMLHQFASIGTECFNKLHPEINNPKVSLFNVGQEQVKGSVIIKETAMMLQEDENINYNGYVEGDRIVDSDADIIVVDGFTGNIALKSIEGAIKCMLGPASKLRNVILFLLKPWIKKRIALMPGPAAMLLGIKLPVFKVHGSASQGLYIKALRFAHKSAKLDVL